MMIFLICSLVNKVMSLSSLPLPSCTGVIGDFDIELYLSRKETEDSSCKANFSGQSCACHVQFCDIDHTTIGYSADCSHIPGGILYNSCHPSAVDTIEDIPLMERLMSAPNLVCSAAEHIVQDGSRVLASGGGKGTTTGNTNPNAKSGRSEEGSSSFRFVANTQILSITMFLLVSIFVS